MKVLRRHVNVRSAYRPLQHRPEAFNRVRVNRAAHILLGRVVDAVVVVPGLFKALVGVQFVRADSRARHHVVENVRLKAFTTHIRHDARDYVPAALNHANHNRLLVLVRPLALTAHFAANERLVNLNVSAKHRVAVHVRHVSADQMSHAKRRGVADAQLALQFLCGNPVARRGEKVDCIEPLHERRMAVREDCALHRVNVVAAIAGVGGLLGELPKLADFAAFRAPEVLAEPQAHQVLKAGFLSLEAVEKVLNCERFCHGEVSYD